MHTDRQIDALLARGGEAGSIFDRLMAMPHPATAAAADEWDRAVTNRLEVHLSRRMRDLLGAGDACRDAA